MHADWTQSSNGLAGALALITLASACNSVVTSPPPTNPPSSSTLPTGHASASPTAPAGTVSPLPSVPAETLDLTAITQICEDWGAEAPPGLIECAEGLRFALAAVVGDGSTVPVDRAQFGFGEWCPEGPPCPERRPDRAWVVVVPDDGRPSRVALERGADGGLLVGPPEPTAGFTPPPFDPPDAARPEFGGAVPDVVRDRVPLAFCGQEVSGLGGPFETLRRRCFLDGVLTSQGVEFVSTASGTEGDAMLIVFRFGGSGPILRYVRDGLVWTEYRCGIGQVQTEFVFTVAGKCASAPL